MIRLIRILSLVSGVGLFVFFVSQLDLDTLQSVLRNPWLLALAIATSCGRALAGVWGFTLLFSSEAKKSRAELLSVALQTSLVNLTLPLGGFALKAKQLKKQSAVSYKQSLPAMAFFSGLRIISALAALAALLLASSLRNWSAMLLYFPLAMMGGLAASLFARSSKKLGLFKEIWAPPMRTTMTLLAIDFMVIVLSSSVIWLLAESLGVSLEPTESLLSASAAMAASAIPFFPGGIGLRELTFLGTFSAISLSLGWIATFAVLERLINVAGRVLSLISLEIFLRRSQ